MGAHENFYVSDLKCASTKHKFTYACIETKTYNTDMITSSLQMYKSSQILIKSMNIEFTCFYCTLRLISIALRPGCSFKDQDPFFPHCSLKGI